MKKIIKKYDFFKTKYGDNLLIDLIRLESLEKYIAEDYPHVLNYYDITLLTGGTGTFYIDQYQYPIQQGIVLLSSPGQIRYWDYSLLPTGYVLIFEEEFLSCFLNDVNFVTNLKYFNTYSSPPQLSLHPADVGYLVELMQDIEKEIKTFSLNDKHILRALLFQVLVWLDRKYSAAYSSSDRANFNRHIGQFTKLVEKEFRLHHSVAYYAGELNITAGHLNDLHKSHTGISAKKYIQNRIIAEAKRLLLYSDLQVAEIASHLNFDDMSYFARMFRKSAGVTPLAFRELKNP